MEDGARAGGAPSFPADPPRRGHPSAWLPFSYQLVPGWLRLALSRRLVGAAAIPASPPREAFAVDDPAHDVAATWGNAARAAVALSHDIDTHRGVAQVEAILDVEEALGVRSTLFLPGALAERHAGAVAAWQARGFEVGLHDVRHDNRLPSLRGADLERRLEAIARAASRFGMRGFRAPSLWMSAALVARLPAPLTYDSSFVSYRARARFAGDRGLGTCRPLEVGSRWEIPVSLPLDDDLLRGGVAREDSSGVLGSWIDAVAARGGVAVTVDHLEPHLSGNRAGRAAHRELVTRVQRDPTIWITTLGAIVAHLRTRAASAATATFQSRR